MKGVIKGLIALATVAAGLYLGAVLLPEYIWWKMLLFAAACCLIGQLVYRLIRMIDKKFES